MSIQCTLPSLPIRTDCEMYTPYAGGGGEGERGRGGGFSLRGSVIGKYTIILWKRDLLESDTQVQSNGRGGQEFTSTVEVCGALLTSTVEVFRRRSTGR